MSASSLKNLHKIATSSWIETGLTRAFFGHCENNSRTEKLKTQAKSRKNSNKIRKKLKNRQVQLSSDGGIFLQTRKFSPFLPSFPHVVNFLNCKFERTVQILQSQYFFTHNIDILIKLCRNSKRCHFYSRNPICRIS